MDLIRIWYLNITLCFFVTFFLGCTKGHKDHKGHHNHSKKVSVSSSKNNKIHVKEAWIRAVPQASKMSAAYMKILNTGTDSDQLISVKSSICEVAEMHNVKKKDGMMKMVPVPFVTIPARGHQELKPSSYHIMLIKLNNIPKIGEVYELTLNFKKAKKVKIFATVKERDPAKNDISHDHG
tara:strand:+ start:1950 stop:2489 length:540 start_codon:yes stop_codon:yes gene_type:complete